MLLSTSSSGKIDLVSIVKSVRNLAIWTLPAVILYQPQISQALGSKSPLYGFIFSFAIELARRALADYSVTQEKNGNA